MTGNDIGDDAAVALSKSLLLLLNLTTLTIGGMGFHYYSDYYIICTHVQ